METPHYHHHHQKISVGEKLITHFLGNSEGLFDIFLWLGKFFVNVWLFYVFAAATMETCVLQQFWVHQTPILAQKFACIPRHYQKTENENGVANLTWPPRLYFINPYQIVLIPSLLTFFPNAIVRFWYPINFFKKIFLIAISCGKFLIYCWFSKMFRKL